MNAHVASDQARRVQQFGLQPVNSTTVHNTCLALLPPDVWAWQLPGSQSGLLSPSDVVPRDIRIGFAGTRFHGGHYGVAKAAAHVAAQTGRPIHLCSADPASSTQMQRDFQAAITQCFPDAVVIQGGNGDTEYLADLRANIERNLRIRQLQRIYGWDQSAKLAAVQDVVDMACFFFGGGHTPGLTFVDTLQAAHSAMITELARKLQLPAPLLLYRRLLPSLRRPGGRGSAKDPDGAIFSDDPRPIIAQKYLHSITGGQSSLDKQSSLGGDPDTCSAFHTVDLLLSDADAESALKQCYSGASCVSCKEQRVDAVVRTMSFPTAPPAAAPTPSLISALSSQTATIHRLPDGVQRLEEAIGTHCGVAGSHVVVGRGSTHTLDLLLDVHSHGHLIAPAPRFELVDLLASRHGWCVTDLEWNPLTDTFAVKDLSAALANVSAVCVVEVPDSISGRLADIAALLRVADGNPDSLFVLDMVYADYSSQRLWPSVQDIEDHPNVVWSGSFSKAHHMLGARLGWLLAPSSLAERVRANRLPHMLDSYAIAAGLSAIRDSEQLVQNIHANRTALSVLTNTLDELSMPWIPSNTNFLLFNPGSLQEDLHSILRGSNATFRDATRWGLPGWTQTHVISPAVITPLLDALEQLRGQK